MDIAVYGHTHEEGGNVYVHLPSGRRPYEEVLTFLRKGTELIKYGRHGVPKSHPFRLSNDDKHLQWESKKGVVRYISLSSIRKWVRGQTTSNFSRYPRPLAIERSFSVYYLEDEKKDKCATLDVIAYNSYEFEMWFWGVQVITQYPPSSFPASAFGAGSGLYHMYDSAPLPVLPGGQQAVVQQLPMIQVPAQDAPQVRSSQGEDRQQKSTPPSKPKAPTRAPPRAQKPGGLSVIVGPTRMSGPMQPLPLPHVQRGKREIGDLYVWGSLLTTEADEWASRMQVMSVHFEEMRLWQQSSVPVLAANTQSMDVLKVACAPRHAALITRKGELYTWGYGKNGNLGHGWCTNVASPRLVSRMSGKGVRVVAVGEGSTAAISSDMRLFMWGSNLAGQLGNGYTFPCAEPVPVLFPGLREDVRVLAVSCGPYHTAAVIEGGLLFTWGNGLFGKLGHGSHASEYRPRRVEALDGKYVKSVSCGYWHTAAVVLLQGPPRHASTPNGGAITPLATPASVATPAAAYQQSPMPGVRTAGGAHPSNLTATSATSATSLAGATVNQGVTAAGAVAAATAATAGAVCGGSGGGGSAGSTEMGIGAGAPPGFLQDSSVNSRVTARLPTSEISSSGSDLQSTIAAANAAAAASGAILLNQQCTATNNLGVSVDTTGAGSSGGGAITTDGDVNQQGTGSGGAPPELAGGAATNASGTGGGVAGSSGPLAQGTTHASTLISGLRDNILSSSINSLDTLKDTMDESGASQMTAGVGALYTWGGDFSWMERLGEHGTPKRDHHGGCLGHGDKDGRTVPTRVRGDLDKYGVTQVACGWSMTVALSADGRLYQMGSTGAPRNAEKSCPWEGALVPTRVDGNLFGMYVEEVACGMHHVIVVASKVQANGMIPEDQRRVRLLTWGRGAEGQLGLDSSSAVTSSSDGPIAQRGAQVDFNLPQVVAAVDGKRVLHISAGGNHTMAVLEHDPRSRRSHPASISSCADPYDNPAATPSGSGPVRGTTSFPQPVMHSVVGAVTSGVRDVSNAASGLLSMSSPFLSQSLPLTAGLQTLGQMVTGSKGSKQAQQQQLLLQQYGHGASSSGGLAGMSSGGGGGMGGLAVMAHGAAASAGASNGSSRPLARSSTRRHQNRMVAIPNLSSSTYVGPASARVDRRVTDLRRTTTRLHHFATTGHGHASAKEATAAAAAAAAATGLSSAACVQEPARSISSGGGMTSRRSSPPLPKGEEPYSRSVSPTSSSLYDMGSTGGDFQSHPGGHVLADPLHHTAAAPVDTVACAAAAAAAAASGGVLAPAGLHGHDGAGAGAAGPTGALTTAAASTAGDHVSSMMDTLSHGGHSIGETAEMTDGETDSYLQGQRGIDLLSEQGGHHQRRGASAALRDQPTPFLEPPEPSQSPKLPGTASAGSGGSALLHSRVNMLAQAAPGVGVTADRALRSSLETIDSYTTTAASGSEGMSPSGMGTPSPDDAISSAPHTHASLSPPQPVQLTQQHQQQPLAYSSQQMTSPTAPSQGPVGAPQLAPAQGPSWPPSLMQPSGIASVAPAPILQPMESIGRAQASLSAAAAATSAGGGNITVTGRPREISISTWTHPAQVAASAAGPSQQAGTTVGGQPSMFRSDVSFRGYGVHGPGESTAAVNSVPTGGAAVGGGPVAGASRSSRGHSRNPSYDSLDTSVRETDGSVAAGALDLAPPAYVLAAAGGSGASTPPRLTAPADLAAAAANLALKQQNELLQQQIEALKQQVALLAQAAGMGAAAAAAGGAAAVAAAGGAVTAAVAATGHIYPPSLPTASSQPVTTTATAAAAAGSGAMLAPSPSVPPPGLPLVPPGQQHHAGGGAAAAAAGMAIPDTVGISSSGPAASAPAVAPHSLAVPVPPAVATISAPSPTSHMGHPSAATSPTAAAAAVATSSSSSPYTPAMSGPFALGLPPLGPSAAGVGRVLADRQASAAGAPPSSVPPTASGVSSAPPGRHRRSASVDVSSLIATRDGIGPAKDYLAPAASVATPPGPAASTAAAAPLVSGSPVLPSAGPHGSSLMSPGAHQYGHGGPQLQPPHHHLHQHHQHQHLDRMSSGSRADGISVMGHHTAPPALEMLRHAHPGMSLAQAAVAEAENEGVDEDEEADDEVDAEEEGDEEDAEEEGEEEEDDGETTMDDDGDGRSRSRRTDGTSVSTGAPLRAAGRGLPDMVVESGAEGDEEEVELGPSGVALGLGQVPRVRRRRRYGSREQHLQSHALHLEDLGPLAAGSRGGSETATTAGTVTAGRQQQGPRHGAGGSEATSAASETNTSDVAPGMLVSDPQHQQLLLQQQRQHQQMLQLQVQQQQKHMQQLLLHMQHQHQHPAMVPQQPIHAPQLPQQHLNLNHGTPGSGAVAGAIAVPPPRSGGVGGGGGSAAMGIPVDDGYPCGVIDGAAASASGTPSGAPHMPAATVYQYAPGVYMHLLPPTAPHGKMQLCKLRFGRRQFSVSEAHAWWRAHKDELMEAYHVWPSLLGGVSRSATPVAYPGSPAAGPGPSSGSPHPHSHIPMQPYLTGSSSAVAAAGSAPTALGGGAPAVALSSGGAGGSGGASMFFSLPANTGLPGGGPTGSGGSGSGYPVGAIAGAGSSGSGSAGMYGRGSGGVAAAVTAAAQAYGGHGTVSPAAPSDPYASWADQVYDDPSLLLPPLPSSGGGGLPPRHNKSRSGSRQASGGAGAGGAAMTPAPSLAYPAMAAAAAATMVASAAAAGALTSPRASLGSFQGGSAGSGSGSTALGGPLLGNHRHARSRSGGAASSCSNRSDPDLGGGPSAPPA